MPKTNQLQTERESKIKYCKEGIIKLEEAIKDTKKQMIPKEEKDKLINNLKRSIEYYRTDLFLLTDK